MSKRAAIYRRVSRSDQSSALQDDECRELVGRRGWKLVSSFVDEGISGAHDRRDGLQQMLEAARKRRFDVLVVWKSDRLFRSLSQLVNTLDELAALGVDFVSCTEPFDSTTPSGRLLQAICGAMAEFERGVLRERTVAGLAAARRRGARLGRPRRAVDAELVQRMRAAGMSARAIARELGVGVATLHRALASVPKTCPPGGV